MNPQQKIYLDKLTVTCLVNRSLLQQTVHIHSQKLINAHFPVQPKFDPQAPYLKICLINAKAMVNEQFVCNYNKEFFVYYTYSRTQLYFI